MTFRIILILSLSMSFAPVSFAEVGTIEDAIEAAITGEEPEYIANAMFELNRKIHQFLMYKDIHDPTHKYALWHTMRVVMCAIYAAGRNAAVEVVGDSARIASENTAMGAARNLLLWDASIDPEVDPGWETCFLATWSIVRPMIFDIARDAIREDDTVQIASRIAEWVALNILLMEFDAIVSPTYDNAINTLYPFRNPFRENAESFDRFYRERFGNADAEVMHILAPWLIHMVPLNLVGVHRRRFESFIGGSNRQRHRPIPAPVDIPMIPPVAASILDSILHSDVLDFTDDYTRER